jgi:endoglucanase
MKTSRFRLILSVLLFDIIHTVNLSASPPDSIRLNQTGFYTYGPKIAVSIEPQTWYFSIRSTDGKTVYFQGELSVQERWSQSRENVKRADFSSFTRKGTYVLYVAGTGMSYPFVISDNPLHDVGRGMLRAFYYQRASTALSATYAGAWSRSAGGFSL